MKYLVSNYIINETEKSWFSLPPRLGGLGINIPSEIASIYYKNSRNMTEVLVSRIIHQHEPDFVAEEYDNVPVKAKIKSEKKEREETKMNQVKHQLNPQKLKVFEAITEK